jgi:hypothetical protein
MSGLEHSARVDEARKILDETRWAEDGSAYDADTHAAVAKLRAALATTLTYTDELLAIVGECAENADTEVMDRYRAYMAEPMGPKP